MGNQIKLKHRRPNSPSCSELCRCSPRSQPNTRSFKMPRWRSFWGGGRDFMNVLRNVTSLPCFLHTDEDGTHSLGHSITRNERNPLATERQQAPGLGTELCTLGGILSFMSSTQSQGKKPTCKRRENEQSGGDGKLAGRLVSGGDQCWELSVEIGQPV